MILSIPLIMSYCEICKEIKDEMDMHSKILCKLCWGKEFDKADDVGGKVWITRRKRYGSRGHKGYYKGKKVESEKGINYY